MNDKMPKVSVCVVTYNQEQYIFKCLESIVEQVTDFDFEVIVSDDCSTDNTRNIINDFAQKYSFIKPILRENNIGAFQNFIQTHNMAKGEYVCHMDGDDYWLAGKLQYQANILDNEPQVVQCWTCANIVADDGKFIRIFPSALAKYFYPEYLKTEDIALSYALVGHHSTQMYRKLAREQYLINKNCLDYWVAFIISLQGKSYYSKNIFSVYRMGKIESITRQKSNKRVTVDLLSEHLLEISTKFPEFKSEVKANMITRKLISKLRGHDLKTINKNLEKLSNIKINPFLVLKSLYYFILQKI